MSWTGIYKKIDEVEKIGSLNCDAWTKVLLEWYDDAISPDRETRERYQTLLKSNAELKTLCSEIGKKHLTILDYGGSVGLSYLAIHNKIEPVTQLEYHIIEVPMVCKIGKSKFSKDSNLHFHTAFPESFPAIDIGYIRTSLQYAEDWKETLSAMAAYQPDHILLTHTSVGNIPSYLSLQQWNGKTVPYWFINMDELKALLKEKGFELLWTEPDQEITADNFNDIPASHQIPHSMKLLFKRSS